MSMIQILTLVASLAHGDASEAVGAVYLTGPEGRLLRIACDVEKCRVVQRLRSGRWSTVEEMPCGGANFNMLEFKYRATGYH